MAFAKLKALLRAAATRTIPDLWDAIAHAIHRRMTNDHGLHVEVQGGEIIITLPGTSLKVIYHKPADKPRLIATCQEPPAHP
jgi:hypothetical protein